MKSEKLPNHVAFIMDGNRRWAANNGRLQQEGHKKGIETVKKIILHAIKQDIKYLTFFLFSSENWNRAKNEVDFLISLIFRAISGGEYAFLDDNGVRIRFLGAKTANIELNNQLQSCEKYSSKNSTINVNLAFNYGGRAEIVNSVKQIAGRVKENLIGIEEINEQLISDNLYTAGIMDPDFLIRTSGEIRISNFLLWQLAYSELYFTDILWPDFSERDFDLALEEFLRRERRYGT
jgi:undecaprenyl diphosphate synthase